MKNILGLICFAILVCSCGGDKKNNGTQNLIKEITVSNDPVQLGMIPDASKLVREDVVAKAFGIETATILGKIGGRKKFNNSKFYKWEDPSYPNNGIFVQVLQNPIADELPQWAEQFVQGKLTTGESGLDGVNYAYESFSGLNGTAAFSYDIKKLFWVAREDLVVSIAFNMDIKEGKLKKIARELADAAISNL